MYDEIKDEELKRIALELIEKEEDEKYKKKLPLCGKRLNKEN
ncbi:MAG: hypothetical protein ACJ8MO_21795 [Bacillus sp. (in: firmicutes)]